MTVQSKGRVVLLSAVILAVVGAVAMSLVVMDSPAEERRQRLDDERERDLAALAESVEDYWKHEDALPPNLDALAEWKNSRHRLADPVSDEPYVYRQAGIRSYELCADFAADSKEPRRRQNLSPGDPFRHHPAGEHCFELEIPEKHD